MNKLLITIFLLGTCFSMNTIAEPYMSDSSKQKYLDFLKKSSVYDDTTYVVLAMASDGCWSTGWGRIKSNAKKMGLKNCKKFCKSSCEIYDVNGMSDFIKKSSSYTSSSSTSTSSTSSSTSSSNKIWCATKNSVSRVSSYSCDLYDGKAFDTESQAQVEHKRLKSVSNTSPGSNYDPAFEIEFWKSIKDSDDPDMFQAYLDEYPNGIFAPLAKIKIKKLKSSGGDDK